MAYMLLILEPAGARQTRPLEDGKKAYEIMLRYTESLEARGLLVASNALKSDSAASRLQMRGGKRHVVDGPFAEAKEMVGGFFLVNCKTKEEALALAAECPAAQFATVEVREIGTCYE